MLRNSCSRVAQAALTVLLMISTNFAATGAPIEPNASMAELTSDDRIPLQLSERANIKRRARELFIKGYQAQKSANFVSAVTYYQSATAANPDMYEAFWNLGLCLEKLGEYPTAKEAFATSLKIDWSNPLVYKHLAYISYQLGNADEGRDWLKKYLRR
jgi:tetratricopeptide (TPR) repeat protein